MYSATLSLQPWSGSAAVWRQCGHANMPVCGQQCRLNHAAGGGHVCCSDAATRHMHIATPHARMQPVAVKVKHPGVEWRLRADFCVMLALARAAATLPVLRDLRFDDSCAQFGVPLQQQLDLSLEARNLERFRHNFRMSRVVSFPRPLWPLVSRDVLVETWAPGRIVRDFVYTETPYNRKIAQTGLQAYLQMMLVDAWMHADLHPGNIIVATVPPPRLPPVLARAADAVVTSLGGRSAEESGCGVRMVIVDAGMTVSLREEHFRALLDLYGGIAAFDGTAIGAAMVRLRHRGSSARVDIPAFVGDIEGIFEGVDRREFRERTQDVVVCVLECLRRHRITMDGAASAVLLTTLALEGWASKLDPDIRILETIAQLIPQPWGRRLPPLVDRMLLEDLVDPN
eukprot:jgi/Ulvmu1/5309/UM022_0103.1